ncbi:DUF2845 domain-containing protein [Thiohalophilus sp.]|uniref:DUF2845 domain-containing protein n=1 Tax=Thiohalophilus sp. TaxID=3028392 RepID=UPI00294FF432|nr:DUF2845 domain-containing protein [Thiohalophilus sp.]
MQCENRLVGEGDFTAEVLRKGGEPDNREIFPATQKRRGGDDRAWGIWTRTRHAEIFAFY